MALSGPDLRPAPAAPTAIDARQRSYALGLLLVIYVFNFVDRSILSILLQPIKAEFQPSDTALGLLSGIAFAVIYSTLGIPIALWADRGSRKTIVSLALFVWSAMTALCGLAQSFGQLLLARIGVGVGEAGCSPPAHSMIADYFPPERRATAFGIYSLGIPIGGAFGVFAGGWINEWFDWRTAFLVVGLPGVLLAIVSQLTLGEPPRVAHASSEPASAASVARHLGSLASFRHLSIAGSLHALVAYGVGTWNAAFLMRTHGMGTGEAGTWLALLALIAGGLGTYLGGVLVDRLGRRDARWSLWLPGLSMLLAAPFSVGFYLLPDAHAALACAAPAALLGATYLAPSFATTQALAPPHMRAAASAVLLFLLNLIGMGLGPLAVGVASDALARGGMGGESLRWALLLVTLVNLWSAAHYALGARTLRADLARAT
jgi:MFS family permease